MAVKAKFKLWERCESARSEHDKEDREPRVRLRMSAVKDDIFGPYTPAGQIEMTVVSSVAHHFELGKEYFVTFEPAS